MTVLAGKEMLLAHVLLQLALHDLIHRARLGQEWRDHLREHRHDHLCLRVLAGCKPVTRKRDTASRPVVHHLRLPFLPALRHVLRH